MRRDFDDSCPFCQFNLTGDKVAENDLAYVKIDEHPITPGHSLIISRRHTIDWFGTTKEERDAINELLVARRQQLLESDPAIEGFNMGMNSGAIAGQTVFHCHFHLIPRRKNDGTPINGGVRGMIKAKMG
jgi:diadenosine tetraphosphate (Ap4A) HIT family hydrolase